MFRKITKRYLKETSMRSKHTLAFACISAVLLAGCASDASTANSSDADVIALKFVTGQPAAHSHSQTFQWWADEVESRTEGRVKVDTYYDGSLSGSEDVVDAVTDGVTADLAYVTPGYDPAAFPLWDLATVPFISDNAERSMLAWTEMYESNALLHDEFDSLGINMLFFFPVGDAGISSPEPIYQYDDLAGLRLRSIGLVSGALASAGVNPVAVSAEEIYENVERGALDGVSAVPLDIFPSFSLDEVAPNLTQPGLGTYNSTGIAINQDTWAELPQDIQDIINEVSLEHQDYSVERIMEIQAEACDTFLDAGGEATEFSDE